MTPRKGKGFAKDVATARKHAGMELLRPHAAGIDVHSRQHYVAVPIDGVPAEWINPDPHLPVGVRVFGTNTGDLEAIAAWLLDCGVKTVALESTGVYGEVLLVIPDAAVLRVFAITSMDRVIPNFPSLAEALAQVPAARRAWRGPQQAAMAGTRADPWLAPEKRGRDDAAISPAPPR